MDYQIQEVMQTIAQRVAYSVTKVRNAAIRAIADTMEETVRFGSFDRKAIEEYTENRLEENLYDE